MTLNRFDALLWHLGIITITEPLRDYPGRKAYFGSTLCEMHDETRATIGDMFVLYEPPLAVCGPLLMDERIQDPTRGLEILYSRFALDVTYCGKRCTYSLEDDYDVDEKNIQELDPLIKTVGISLYGSLLLEIGNTMGLPNDVNTIYYDNLFGLPQGVEGIPLSYSSQGMLTRLGRHTLRWDSDTEDCTHVDDVDLEELLNEWDFKLENGIPLH